MQQINNDLTDLLTELTPSEWTLLSKANNISVYYRYNSLFCEVIMEGALIQAGLNAWQSFTFGNLPFDLKPQKTLMIPRCIPNKYMLQISNNGAVSFVATSSFSGSNDYVSAQGMYFLN